MLLGEGLHLVRVTANGTDRFPAAVSQQNRGPITPLLLCLCCRKLNQGRSAEDDRMYVYDAHGNLIG